MTTTDEIMLLADNYASEERLEQAAARDALRTAIEKLVRDAERKQIHPMQATADNDCAYAYADGWNAAIAAQKERA